MMRFTSVLLASFAGLAWLATASGDEVPDYDAVRTPASPAFTLLGISPTEIDRPNTPKAVAVSLGGFARNGGAIEIAPYWLASHPDLTLAAYRDSAGQLVRNLSVSLGTNAAEADATAGTAASTTLALGVRTSATIAELDDACEKQVTAARKAVTAPAAAGPVDVARLKAALAIEDPTARQQAIQAVLDDANAMAEDDPRWVAAKQQAADLVANECVQSGQADAGLTLELAAATSVGFADDDLDAAALGTSAAWASLAYRQPGLSAIVLTRLRRDRVAGGRQYVLVPGARGVYATGRVAVSLEGILQKQLAKSAAVADLDVTYRATAALDVRVADSTWVTLSFGKDFGDDSSGKLFSLANLKWGYGDPKITAGTADTAD